MVPSAISSAQQTHTPSGSDWTALHRWAFRMAFVYFGLDALPDLLLRVPGGPTVLVPYWKTWNAILPWFGHYILRVPNAGRLRMPITSVLVGDIPGGYVLMLMFLLIAIVVASVWTIAEPRDRNDRMLYTWLRVYVRYALAFSMLGYGISKLFHVQFRSLDLVDWMTPLGMLQPRELLWDFMGFSWPYQVFTGVVECVGVALLFWRRTTPLGSLLLIGALGNVLMLDISYGVQVRRIALRLLLMAVFLSAPDLRRLADLFLFRRTVTLSDGGESLRLSPWARRTAAAMKAVIILFVVSSAAIDYSEDRKNRVIFHPAVYGLYKVQEFLRNGREDAPDDPRRWEWVAVDGRTFAVQLSNANWDGRRVVVDDAKHAMTVSTGRQRKSSLMYSRSGPDDIVVTGLWDDQPTEVHLRRVSDPTFALNDPLPLRLPSIW